MDWPWQERMPDGEPGGEDPVLDIVHSERRAPRDDDDGGGGGRPRGAPSLTAAVVDGDSPAPKSSRIFASVDRSTLLWLLPVRHCLRRCCCSRRRLRAPQPWRWQPHAQSRGRHSGAGLGQRQIDCHVHPLRPRVLGRTRNRIHGE